MNVLRTFALVGAIAALSASSLGQETPAPAPEPAPPPAAETPAGEEAVSPADPRAPVSNDVFIPTQELAADEAVTFPVDI
jgi:hypothetical protein